MVRNSLRLVVGVLLCIVFNAHGDISMPLTLEINLSATPDEIEQIVRTIPSSLPLVAVSSNADVPYCEHELSYLFNSAPGALITPKDIKRGCLLVQQKQRFEKVVITLTPQAPGYALHFEFYGHWTFYAVKIHGFLLNKERFGSYYLLEPGQKFDLEQHQQSLERIKNIFKEDGYCSADVRERLVFDEKTKSVTVHLTIDRRNQFHINVVHVEARSVKGVADEERCKLEQKVLNNLHSALIDVPYSKAIVDQEIKSLKTYLRKKGYLRTGLKVKEVIDRQAHTVTLTFSCTLHPKKKFVFFGNHFFTDQQLLDQISLFGKAALHIPSAIIADEIEDMYKKAGFLKAQVQAEDEGDQFVFVIKEEQRAFVNLFILEGNQAFTSQEFIQAVLNEYQGKYLDAETRTKIEDKVNQWYSHKGFWDALASIVNLEGGRSGAYTVYLRIQEGKQRFFGGVTLPDLVEPSAYKRLAWRARDGVPIPFDSNLLEQQRHDLIEHLHHKGLLYTYLKPEFEEKDGVTYVQWRITGDVSPITFGKTVILGNSCLAYEKIAREITCKEGMVWNNQHITRTLDNLHKLGIFESISLRPLDGLDNEESKPLVLHIVDGSPCDARLRLGYQQVSNVRGSTYKVGGSVLLKNPTNQADYLRCDADMTRFYRSLSVHYEIPWIFNQPIHMALKGYRQTYDQPIFIGSPDVLYTADHDGICINFLRSWDQGDIGCSSGCDWLRIRRLSPIFARAINFEPRLIGQRIPYIFLEPHILINRLDDCLNPTWGSLTMISLRAMLACSDKDLSLVKGLFEQSFFFPLTQRMIGAFRWRFGHIFHDTFSTLLPSERFYLGGMHSLRGYEPNMAPPLACVDVDGRVCVPLGGKTMMNMNIELRTVLIGNLGGVIFHDMGVLMARELFNVSVEDVSMASGFGLRYATPIGPLRFDLGYKWKKRFDNDCRTTWYVTFGHAF